MNRGDIKLAIDMLTSMNDDETCDHVIGVLEKCGNTIAKLEKQRDELLDVSEEILAWLEHGDHESEMHTRLCKAISSVKESK